MRTIDEIYESLKNGFFEASGTGLAEGGDMSLRLMAVAAEMSRQYREALVGTVQEVLFEEPDGEFYTGHAPNYVKIYAPGSDLHNELRTVEITGLHKDGLLGRIMESVK